MFESSRPPSATELRLAKRLRSALGQTGSASTAGVLDPVDVALRWPRLTFFTDIERPALDRAAVGDSERGEEPDGAASTESTAPAEGSGPTEDSAGAAGLAGSRGPLEDGSLARLLDEGAAQLERARTADRAMAAAAGARARALVEFARLRPAGALDRGPGEVGAASADSRAARPAVLTDVSEWAADEVALALQMSPAAATALLVTSVTLVEQLPATLAMVQAGRLSWAHAGVLAELLASLTDEETRAAVEARLLERAEGKSLGQLRAAARRAVARANAAAATDRLLDAVCDRHVRLSPREDGMSSLAALLPTPVARAAYTALEQYAEACRTEGDERTADQRMADCLVDLILRPGAHGMPPVQVSLTVVAAAGTLLGGDEPGEVDGEMVPAALVRELAYTLGLLPRPTITGEEADPTAQVAAAADAWPRGGEGAYSKADAADQAGAAEVGSPPAEGAPVVEDVPSEDRIDPERAPRNEQAATPEPGCTPRTPSPVEVEALAALLGIRRIAGTTLAHRPHIAVTDPLTGALLALTDATGIRCGEPLGPPPDTPGYRPSTELDRFVRLRDRRCRFPGCRARPRKCDLDHTCPYPHGPTSHTNLCAVCEHHHRLSHQAPGWRLHATPDGGLAWTTPGGIQSTTYPPRFGADDDLRPAPRPITAGPSRREPAVDDDPPPF